MLGGDLVADQGDDGRVTVTGDGRRLTLMLPTGPGSLSAMLVAARLGVELGLSSETASMAAEAGASCVSYEALGERLIELLGDAKEDEGFGRLLALAALAELEYPLAASIDEVRDLAGFLGRTVVIEP